MIITSHHHPDNLNNFGDISVLPRLLLPPLPKTLSSCKEHEYTVLYNMTIANEFNHNKNLTPNDVQDDDAAFQIDDANLFAQLHGGCLHHFMKTQTID